MDLIPKMVPELKWKIWSYLDCLGLMQVLKQHNALGPNFLEAIRGYRFIKRHYIDYDLSAPLFILAIYVRNFSCELFGSEDGYRKWWHDHHVLRVI